MAQVSSAVTGGVTISAATIQPIVEWALTGFHGAAPAMLSGLITAAALTAGHYLINRFTAPPASPAKSTGVAS